MIDEFIEITYRVIAKDGFDEYIPTMLLPISKEVLVLEDVPEYVNIDITVSKWIERKAKNGKDFIVAYKINNNHFKVIARINGNMEERICETKHT